MKQIFLILTLVFLTFPAAAQTGFGSDGSFQGYSGEPPGTALPDPTAPSAPLQPAVPATPSQPLVPIAPIAAPANPAANTIKTEDPCAAYMAVYESYVVCQDRLQKIERMKQAKQKRLDSKKPPTPATAPAAKKMPVENTAQPPETQQENIAPAVSKETY